MRRRELLQGGAGLALGLGLAGCGVGDEAKARPRRPTERVVKAEPDGDLVYFNWSEYLEPKLIKEFEKQYGVKVRESNFDSMQGMMAKLRSGNRYDVIFPTAEWADRLIKANQLLRIDQEQITNAEHGLRLLRQALVRPGRRPHGALRDVRERDHLPQATSRADAAPGTTSATRRPTAAPTCSTTSRRSSARATSSPAPSSTRPTPPTSRRRSSGRSTSSPSCAASRPTTSRTWCPATPGSTTAGTATSSTSATRSRSPRTTRSRSAARASRSARTASRSRPTPSTPARR